MNKIYKCYKVRKNDTIQKTRHLRRSKIKIKHWIIRAVEIYEQR